MGAYDVTATPMEAACANMETRNDHAIGATVQFTRARQSLGTTTPARYTGPPV